MIRPAGARLIVAGGKASGPNPDRLMEFAKENFS